MAGHSKWSNIKHRKGANDARRARIFTRLLREVEVASRSGSEAESNPRLRTALLNARAHNVPVSKIENARQRGSQPGGTHLTHSVYEACGPYGVAWIIVCLTDNANRTAGLLRATLTRHGSHLSKSGSVSHLFERISLFRLPLAPLPDWEGLLLELMDYGVHDTWEEEGYGFIAAPLTAFGTLQQALEGRDLPPYAATTPYHPLQELTLDSAQQESIEELAHALEEIEDVDALFHNLTSAPQAG